MARSSSPSTRTSALYATSRSLVIMFYNIWFREDVQVLARMAAIGELIEEHQPHVICLQEVTFGIYQIFQTSSWWGRYQCSVSESFASKPTYFALQLTRLPVKAYHRHPYSNSVMGRDLCMAEVDAGNGKKLVVATSHLESPLPATPTGEQRYTDKRVLQARIAFKHLEDIPNVIFGGDMNWNDEVDGAPPLPHGWYDAWLQLKPQETGTTFDSQANPMISGSFSQRLDRIFCHLTDFRLENIQIIGKQAIPGVTFEKEKTVTEGGPQASTVPVLPSDHFGLVLKVRYEVIPEVKHEVTVIHEPQRVPPRRASLLCCCQAQ